MFHMYHYFNTYVIYIGLNQFLLQWIAYYLFKRKQHVVVNGESSTDTSVISGVPQVSVLGPLLFLSYINSISHLPLSNGAQMTLYADDILLIKPICETNDYNYVVARGHDKHCE